MATPEYLPDYLPVLDRARRAQLRMERARAERDEAIHGAAELGASRRQIASAVGIALGTAQNSIATMRERRSP